MNGRPALRDLFDGAPTPHIAHPPRTHRRDYYVATDGSFFTDGGGIGAIIETATGECLLRLSRQDDAPDNNVAEYRALHLGLDTLADRVPSTVSVGVLVDHNDLAANVNAASLGMEHRDWPLGPVTIPNESKYHWQGIRNRISGFTDVRAACIHSDDNPAHFLANTPEAYAHLTEDQSTLHSVSREWEIPPPSRANRHADD